MAKGDALFLDEEVRQASLAMRRVESSPSTNESDAIWMWRAARGLAPRSRGLAIPSSWLGPVGAEASLPCYAPSRVPPLRARERRNLTAEGLPPLSLPPLRLTEIEWARATAAAHPNSAQREIERARATANAHPQRHAARNRKGASDGQRALSIPISEKSEGAGPAAFESHKLRAAQIEARWPFHF